MEVKIDNEMLQNAINGTVAKSVGVALGSYDVQTAIGGMIAKEVVEGAIGEAIRMAIDKVNTAALVETLAKEIARSATAATVTILDEAMLETLCRIKGIDTGPYAGDKSRAEKERLRAQVGARKLSSTVKVHDGDEIPM